MTAHERRRLRKNVKAAYAEAIARASTMCELRATSRAFDAALKAIRKPAR